MKIIFKYLYKTYIYLEHHSHYPDILSYKYLSANLLFLFIQGVIHKGYVTDRVTDFFARHAVQ